MAPNLTSLDRACQRGSARDGLRKNAHGFVWTCVESVESGKRLHLAKWGSREFSENELNRPIPKAGVGNTLAKHQVVMMYGTYRSEMYG